MVVGKYICNQLGDVFIVFQFIEKRIGQYLIDYKSLPNFCCSLLIFFYFSKLDIGSKKWINILAKSALAVYIIHQVPAFYNFLWKNIYRCDIWNSSDFFMLGIFGVIITVYIGAIVIDGLRRKFIEPKWVKSSLFKNISCKLEKFYDI